MGRMKWRKRRLSPWQLTFVARLAWAAIALLCSTMRFRSVGEERLQRKGAVMMAWHGQQFLGFYYFKGRGYAILSSLSKDGDVSSSIMRRFGWKIIRGSSSKGGARGLIELIRHLRQGGIAGITPDGPSGPIYHIEPGVIYMAQKTGVPLIPFSFSLDRAWELNSWDRFIIPKPFSRCLVYFGPEIYIPSEITEEEFEQAKEDIATAIHHANMLGRKELEAWLEGN